jgi:hypothetical protein
MALYGMIVLIWMEKVRIYQNVRIKNRLKNIKIRSKKSTGRSLVSRKTQKKGSFQYGKI